MLVIKPYRRDRAVEYARKYAFLQNPIFGNFRGIGGNCTNFVSQSIYAGSCVMNYTPTYGWYYVAMDNRSPSWTGVDYFFNFMTGNLDVGPFGRQVGADELENGDVIQLGREADGFYHTLLVVGFDGEDPLVAAQTDDAFARPLSTYTYDYSRFIKIDGVRVNVADSAIGVDCYQSVLDGVSIVTPPGTVLPPPNVDNTPLPPEEDAE